MSRRQSETVGKTTVLTVAGCDSRAGTIDTHSARSKPKRFILSPPGRKTRQPHLLCVYCGRHDRGLTADVGQRFEERCCEERPIQAAGASPNGSSCYTRQHHHGYIDKPGRAGEPNCRLRFATRSASSRKKNLAGFERHGQKSHRVRTQLARASGDGQGAPLLERNPLKGLSLPREENPRRPLVTDEQYRQLRRIASQVDPNFELALVACVRSVLLEQEMVAMSSTGTCFAPLPRMKKDNS
jgi:hypothetical protein